MPFPISNVGSFAPQYTVLHAGEMDTVEPSRRHRRRGKGTRRKHQTTLENLQPGRAPLGLRPDETTFSNTHLAELDSDSELSEEDALKTLATNAYVPPHSTRSILQVFHLLKLSTKLTTFKPPSPNLPPLLTSRADTPMLGAQARAAELAAASAAKKRQVSRELEERQLPPNPAVSLSAFTKPQPITSRNKGNKNWKPLILDDIVEADDALSSDPTTTPSNPDRLTSKEASDKKIPIAPRAMVAGRSLSTVVAYPQPPRRQTSPVINMPARNAQGYESAHHGGVPYPVFPQNMYLPRPIFIAGMPMNDAPSYQTFGSMMVPDDISPTKQEQKFSMLENIPLPHMMHGQEMSHFAAPQDGMMQHDDPFSQGTTQTFRHNQQYMWDPSNQDAYYRGYPLPYQQHGSFENESDGNYTNSHLLQAPIQRLNPTPARRDSAVNQRAILPIRRNSGQQTPNRYQEPYDTERAMKECVSELKEKAKDGRTVLHNPDIHKEQLSQTAQPANMLPVNLAAGKSSNNPQPVPWDVRPQDGNKKGSDWEVIPPPADTLNEPSPFADRKNDPGFVKPAPGLPLPSTFGLPQLSLNNSNVETQDSSTAPQVGSAEWMRLGPITNAERDRVRRCMAVAAKSVTNDVSNSDITSGQAKEDLSETQNWFHHDARGERLLREQVDLSAQKYASQVIANIKSRNGGELPEQFKNGKDDGLAASLILGNVACNLQTYLVGDRKSVEQRKNFHKVTNVPDWCTERGGPSLGGLGGGDSYFDGAAGGFYGAPVRVARDPRFRPQVKEGMKVKPEEEWKNRHEMYGRRMM